MSLNMWYTKDDILNDLAKATGLKCLNSDLDENFIVMGERPPPSLNANSKIPEDLVQFIGASRNDVVTTPDIKGISNMLNMVKQDNNYNNVKISNNHKESSNGFFIRKLNPNVEELIPNTSNCDIAINTSNNLTAECQRIKDLTEKLKNKIKENYKEETPQNRREKNTALMSLLKLHTAVPTEDCTQNVNEPKPSSSHEGINNDNPKNVTDMDAEGNVENFEITQSEETIQSINKVYNWLNENSKQKCPRAPLIYLNPVTFKIKEKKNESTANETCSDTDYKNCTLMPNEYVPSSYSNKLYDKYVQQSKLNEKKILDIWTKLEQQLTIKDEKLKNKQKNSNKGASI